LPQASKDPAPVQGAQFIIITKTNTATRGQQQMAALHGFTDKQHLSNNNTN
jgi:hypothetical protein